MSISIGPECQQWQLCIVCANADAPPLFFVTASASIAEAEADVSNDSFPPNITICTGYDIHFNISIATSQSQIVLFDTMLLPTMPECQCQQVQIVCVNDDASKLFVLHSIRINGKADANVGIPLSASASRIILT